jgi:hypothetical protein
MTRIPDNVVDLGIMMFEGIAEMLQPCNLSPCRVTPVNQSTPSPWDRS